MAHPSEINDIDKKRRRFLVYTSSVIGAIGGTVAAVPFISSMLPSARARAAGAPVTVDISKMEYGSQITVEWRGKPVWILRRNQQVLERLQLKSLLSELSDAESNTLSQQPNHSKNVFRSIKAEYLVVIGICTHLGCVPTFRPELAPQDLGKKWLGGYFCPCHGSRFDLAGRVFKGVPAPTNLEVPPHHFMNDSIIEIGMNPYEHTHDEELDKS